MFWIIGVLMLGAQLEVGAVAPDFSFADTDGKVLELKALIKEGPVILAFFPKAFTPG